MMIFAIELGSENRRTENRRPAKCGACPEKETPRARSTHPSAACPAAQVRVRGLLVDNALLISPVVEASLRRSRQRWFCESVR